MSLLAFTLAALAFLAPEMPPQHELADAIASAAEERPIFAGDDGRRTAALLVSLAWWETGQSLDGSRVGDHGHSITHFQIWVCPGIRCERAKVDIRFAAAIARDMAATSMRACRRLPVADRLAQYTTGRCMTNREARMRWRTSERLFRMGDAP